ncbi:unnamed protein product [Pedinophyceae sp. YPF-701]|nr:unnamed protein product [Pedinophyceae sp. YPF-701]
MGGDTRWFGPLDARILSLAAPALGTLAIDPLLGVVDTAFVGRLGAEELAGLAPANSVFTFAFLCFNFLSQATAPLVGQALAAEDDARARKTAGQAITLAVVLGSACCVLLETFGEPALAAVAGGAAGDGGVLEQSLGYLQVRALGLPAVLVSNACGGVFRGLLDTRTPLKIALGANLVNFVLDPILIFGLPGAEGALGAGLGVRGAAAATAVSEWAGAAWYLTELRRTQIGGPARLLEESGARLPSWDDVAPLVRAGGALILRTSVLQAMLLLATAEVAHGPDGAIGVAAHQVSIQGWMLLSFTMDSIAVAAQGLVAEASGGRDIAMARTIAGRALAYGLALGVVAGGGLWCARGALIGGFTTDQDVGRLAESSLGWVAGMQPLNSVAFVGDGILSGAGDFGFMAAAMCCAAGGAGTAMLGGVGSLTAVWQSLTVLQAGRCAGILARLLGAGGGPLAPVAQSGKTEGRG